ncbi:MAG: N,N-dimethylformamidase beta subunit family domain-containing protein, partial [Ilumatobacteraceae bacterium]
MDESGIDPERRGHWTRRAFVQWLAGTAGAAFMTPWLADAVAAADSNPITNENALLGSYGWYKVFSNQSQLGEIEGYASATSVRPGQQISFHVSTAPAASYRIEIYRIGYYGGRGSRLMATLPGSGTLAGSPQPIPSPDPATGRISPSWPAAVTLTVPDDWVSGYYMALFEVVGGANNEKNNFYPFVVTAPPSRPKVGLVHASATTWQAYNNWPGVARNGKSLYDYNSSSKVPASKVSFLRPYNVVGNQNVFEWEAQFAQWLERIGYDVAYTTGVDTHRDPGLLSQYRLVIVNGHDEYWSSTIRDGFESAVQAGVNLAFVGANLAYWNIRLEDTERTVVAYKDYAPDPIGDPSRATVKFRDLVPPRPEASLIGVQFMWGMPNGYRTYDVVPAALSDPWFNGTGFVSGDVVPDVVGYEYDTVVPGVSPANLTTFFSYVGSPGEELPAGHCVRYTHASGATVFSTATMEWPIKMATDARLAAFTKNAFDALFNGGGPPPPPNDPPVVALTAPPAGSSAQVGSVLRVEATASDPDGTIARVVLMADGATIGEPTAAPFGVDWIPSSAGTVTLTARAFDAGGASTLSAPVSVEVLPAPLPSTGIGFVGASKAGNNGSSASLVLPVPPGVVEGDVLLAGVQVSTSVTGVGAPEGWSVVQDFVPTQSWHPRLLVISKVAASGEPALTIPTGWVGKSGVLLAYRGVDQASPVAASSATSKDGTSVTVPSIVVPTGGAQLVGIFASQNHASAGTFTPPPEMVERAAVNTLAWLGISAADGVVAAGATGGRTATFSATGAALAGVLVGLRPGAPAPPPPPSNQSPTVEITSPSTGAVVVVGTSVPVTVAASDADGTIARVEFLAGGAPFAERTVAPFSATWVPTTAGTVLLSARATDDAGASTTSADVSVVVQAPAPPPNTPPTVSLTAPQPGAVVTTGSSVTVTAAATDTDGTIARVEFLANGTKFGEGTTAPYTVSWVPSSAGPVTLTARAVDDDGTPTTSAGVAVTVQSPAPPPSISLVGSSQAGDKATSSSLVLQVPSARVAGDLLLVAIEIDKSVRTLTTPSGFSVVRDFVPASSRQPRIAVYSRISNGTESTVTIPTGRVNKTGVLLVYRNVNATAPVAASSTASRDNTTLTLPSVSVPTAGARLVGIFAAQRYSSTGSFTAPSGMTERAAMKSLTTL